MGELWTPGIDLVAWPAVCPWGCSGDPCTPHGTQWMPRITEVPAYGTRTPCIIRRHQGALKSLVLNISSQHLLSGRIL